MKLTLFVTVLKDVTMVCNDAILPELLLKKYTFNCLTFQEQTRQPYNDNWCPFRTPALHLHGNQRLEEKNFRKKIISYVSRTDGDSPNQFHGLHFTDSLVVEDLLPLGILLHDTDVVDGNTIGELATRSVQKQGKKCNY